MNDLKLTQQELERYNRHLQLNEIGESGQLKLKNSSVLIVGVGGLGSPIALYLAAAGVGKIGIVEHDNVSESNLQRQILYRTSQLNKPKGACAKTVLEQLNPLIEIEYYDTWLTAENATSLIPLYDVVVDATDNLTSRYIIDEVCAAHRIPMIYGSICEYSGQISVFNYGNGHRYADLYPYSEEVPSFHQPLGVVGALPGVIGSLQAFETIKVLLDKSSLDGVLLLVDLLTMEFQKIKIP